MSTAAATEAVPAPRKLPPVLGRLLSGSFWLALRTPLQAVFALWTIPLVLRAVGRDGSGAYGFAWGFGFFQFLLEFGMSSALQRRVSEAWTKGDRDGVDRAVSCGLNFYAAMAFVQVAALLGVAYGLLPYLDVSGKPRDLIVKLLWLQAVTAPCYGLSVVVASVLHAARRYDFTPRLDLAVVVLRFIVLYVGVTAGVDFFLVVVGQTIVQTSLTLIPGLWVVVRQLGHWPRFRGARAEDYRALMHVSFFMFLLQLSVVLSDKVDTTVLGVALSKPGAVMKPLDAIAVYNVVSKPFLQIRQSGWMLAYFVMPAVASLVAARDERALDRVKYDGTRLHVGMLLPIGLLAWVYAAPFLALWVGDDLGYDAASEAPLLRLFMVGTLPLVLAVLVQTGFGMNKVEVVALSALAGSLVNLPLSYYLTTRLGTQGVIWGTVVTTLFSNLLVPGVYLFRVLEISPRRFLTRTLCAPACGAAALLATTWAAGSIFPLNPGSRGLETFAQWVPLDGYPFHRLGLRAAAAAASLLRWVPMAAHVGAGCLGYAAGYLAVPTGRGDLVEIVGKFKTRRDGASG